MSVVVVQVTSENSESERRFEKGISIYALKVKLELITGIPADFQQLDLYDESNLLGTLEGDPDRLLGSFPIENGYRIGVEKFELSQGEYAKRQETLLAFKKQNKLGRFAENRISEEQKDQALQAEAAKTIKPGDRCQVEADGMLKRGTVMFVGETKIKPGVMVGVEYDEPLGKHDGSVQGTRYFECRPKHGAFLRPLKVNVGDFPEVDLDDLDEE